MLPEEVFKRRHFNTPESFFLITVNYVVVAIAFELFASCKQINSLFWISIALLALYNFYQIRREREEYNKVKIIAYIISLLGLVFMFFAFRSGSKPC